MVLPNRLYLDQDENKAREMDVLAYRVSKGKEVHVCTVVMISCKAREARPWVLVTREWPQHKERFFPYPPIPIWTNTPSLSYQIKSDGWEKRYFDEMEAAGLVRLASDAPREAFAPQECEAVKDTKKPPAAPTKYKPKGDSSLYDSVISLLKAMKHEIDGIPERHGGQKRKIVFQLNLICLLDGEMYEGALTQQGAEVVQIDRYRYFAQTMTAGKSLSARVDFCTRSALPTLLQELVGLHNFNLAHFNGEISKFYEGIEEDVHRANALSGEVGTYLAKNWWRYQLPSRFEAEWSINVSFHRPRRTLSLYLPYRSDQIVASFAKDSKYEPVLIQKIKEIFRTTWDVELESFEDYIPF
jgi:hypothetical protein